MKIKINIKEVVYVLMEKTMMAMVKKTAMTPTVREIQDPDVKDRAINSLSDTLQS